MLIDYKRMAWKGKNRQGEDIMPPVCCSFVGDFIYNNVACSEKFETAIWENVLVLNHILSADNDFIMIKIDDLENYQ